MGNLLTCCDSVRPGPPPGQDGKGASRQEGAGAAGLDGAEARVRRRKKTKGEGLNGIGTDEGDMKPKLKGMKWKKLKKTVRNKEALKILKEKANKEERDEKGKSNADEGAGGASSNQHRATGDGKNDG